ncbi:caldesmon-like isoform X1 [Haliotis rubra]|uniref:caldesmon-like isoform X1 n=1 Tax=Haliotis rubra TaxID=36100 RepID=UPI001EE5762D|nr:caldesmon-like isoform X1 [Haliotis rubra]XP_046578294.1 caldesmon-like isoform X1 [Haliotis rubra]XP_046578300.1 caldesmon-like isoform X1 [Haliotis rubra]
MSTVCNWLSIFLCLRDSPKKPIAHKIHPNHRGTFDAVILWKGKEGAKERKSGLAYEVILKPASAETTPLKPQTPPKDKNLTQDDILKKLQKAQERREVVRPRVSLEAQRLEQISRERARAQEKIAKVQEESESFSKQTKEKLRRSMEISKENRELQIKALQERLREHLSKVEETCKRSDSMAKELEERINQKMEIYEENRQAQLDSLLKRLKDHASHIKEVCEASENMGKMSEEKILVKMETALKNREEQLKALQERLQEHERRIEEVRKNKSSLQSTGVDA